MRADRQLWAAVAAWLLLAAPVRAQTTPQEKQRADILRELGLQKKPLPPPSAVPPPPAEAGSEDGGGPAGPRGADNGAAKAEGGPGRRAAPTPTGPSFRRTVHPLFVTTCKPCHTAGGAAAASRFLLSGDELADHRAIVGFVTVRAPDTSVLLAKAAGTTLHGGGALWPAGSAAGERVLAWVRAGARLDGGGPAPPTATTTATPSERGPPAAPRTLGSRRLPPTEAAPPSAQTEPVASSEAAPPTPAGEPAPLVSTPAPRSTTSFATAVHPVLINACAACHRTGGPAAATRLVFSGDAGRDEVTVRSLLNAGAPDESPLLRKAAGEMHGGGPVLPPGDPRLQMLVDWARGLSAGTPPTSPAPASAAPPPALPVVVAAPSPHSPHLGAGLPLPLGFLLNGRFSLDYERRQFSGSPFADGSVNALRSYHHFLFLSRDVADDPCGLSVEVLTLQFWEAHCRLPGMPRPLRVTVAGGKIIVPFGADPLTHQSYGGLAGFDQPILPVIWAVEGMAGHLVFDRGTLVLTDDLYVVRGFALNRADAVINLQSDLSALDDAQLAWGNRLGVAWMFASAWYSAYFNPLGFGRRLFMQAVDLTVWRPRGVPVLGHFSLGAGLLRADVSGGGPGVGGVGHDYYDFGSYLQVRYYPTDWLYLQYRGGLRTFNNRRGVILDKTRLTSADASAHNFGVVARHRGLSAGLYWFVNLEKVDELPNDFLRLSVTYEF